MKFLNFLNVFLMFPAFGGLAVSLAGCVLLAINWLASGPPWLPMQTVTVYAVLVSVIGCGLGFVVALLRFALEEVD